MEAFRIIDRDEASIADVDTAMKLGAGMPMGPMELADVSYSFEAVLIFLHIINQRSFLIYNSSLVWIQ